ncbi:MAG: alpha-ketoglutarate-dependent dioxygenase AlkB [Luteolibacter sp.]
MSHIEIEPEASILPGFLDPAAATRLFDDLCREVAWDERMKSRKTACFGQTYDDSGVDYEVVPMPPRLEALCGEIERELGFRATNCLLNYYESGNSSMGFHSDATYNLAEGTGVAIVSLGAERELTFRNIAEPTRFVPCPMPHGSLFYMTQLTQAHWMHAVKKDPAAGPRISLTFRRILSPEELAARQSNAV